MNLTATSSAFFLFPFVLFYFFKVRLLTSLCSRSDIFARRTACKYVTDKLISLSLPHNLSAKEDLHAFITQNN